MDEVVVLRDDLRTGPREIEGVGFFGAAEIVQLEDEVPGEVGFVAPDYPANAGVDKPEFVAGCVDGFDARELEIPIVVGGQMGRRLKGQTGAMGYYHFGPPAFAYVKGAIKPPLAASTWMGMSIPVFFSYSSRMFEISSTGS